MPSKYSPVSRPMSHLWTVWTVLAAGCLFAAIVIPACAGENSILITPAEPSQDPVVVGSNDTEAFCPNSTFVKYGPNGKACAHVVRQWSLDCMGYIMVAGIAGFFALSLTVPCLLAALGFGAIGITFGSLAACFQGSCGTPVCFRCMQSAAMVGVSLGARGWMGGIGFVTGAVVASYWLPMCFTEETVPSHGSS